MSLHEPFDIMDITLKTNDSHATLGLHLRADLTVLSCIPGTPAAKIKGWRQTIKNATLHTVGGHKVLTLDEVQQHLASCLLIQS